MKRCPTCQRTFIDETQKFCPSDGTPLMGENAPAFDPEATVMSSASQLKEEAPSQAPPAPPQPPTPYYNPDAGAGAQPAQNIHQSAPPPGGSPPPAWPSAPPQQQPYYPQPGTPGAQPAPQWQGGPQQPGWTPGQPPPQAQWGAGGYYPQQPGQYAQFGAPPAAGGKSAPALAALICGIVAFVSYAAAIVIIGTRMTDLYDLIWALRWLWLATGTAGIVLGIIGLISSKTSSGKTKAGIGLLLGFLTLLLYMIGFARWVV